tara:strand:- start:688 stop:1050 length:363 start_codon:yes stop_codon:yes gene_type:complete
MKKKIYVVGESWCPFTKEAWEITDDEKIQIEKVDCGTCSRIEDTTYSENDGTQRKTTASDCKKMCDLALGYPAYLIKSTDKKNTMNCPDGYGFNNENATMERLRYCVKHFFPSSDDTTSL